MTTELTIRLSDKEARRVKKAVSARTNEVRQKRAELWSDDPRGRGVSELSDPVKPENVDIRQGVNKIIQYGLRDIEK